MQSFNPFYEHHLAVLILAIPQLLANRIDQFVEVEHESFVERSINYILEQIVDLLGVVLHVVGHGRANEPDDFVEDIQEVLVSQNSFFANLDDVEHGVTRCQLNLLVFVIETLDHWRQQLIKQVEILFVVIESDGDNAEAVESRPPLLGIVFFVTCSNLALMLLPVSVSNHGRKHVNPADNYLVLIIF